MPASGNSHQATGINNRSYQDGSVSHGLSYPLLLFLALDSRRLSSAPPTTSKLFSAFIRSRRSSMASILHMSACWPITNSVHVLLSNSESSTSCNRRCVVRYCGQLPDISHITTVIKIREETCMSHKLLH